MSETATRRQRRPISSNLAPAAQASIGVSVPAMPQPGTGSVGAQDALQTFLEYLRDVDRMKRYRLIGRLSRVQILRPSGAKTLDFRKDGPVLAFATGSEQLIVTDPWRGIPPKWDDTDEFCKACSSDCDVCGATGKKLCEAYKCGGAGRVPLPTVLCPADDCLAGGQPPGRAIKPGCDICRGTGNYTGTKVCAVCEGTGRAKCGLCRGTGKRPTGILGGSTNYRELACPECGGSKFNHREIPQPLEEFIDTRIGSMISIGPIVRFAVEAVGGEGSPPQVYDVSSDANGQHLVILLESAHPGSRVYMIGGVLQARTR